MRSKGARARGVLLTLTLSLALTSGLSACAPGSPVVGPAGSAAPHGATAPAGGAAPGGGAQSWADGSGLPPNPNRRGIANAAQMTSCTTAPGKVVAEGTVTPREAGTVTLSVSWTDASTSRILTRAWAELHEVSAGQTRAWTIEAELPATEATVRCVLGATMTPR